MDSFIRAVKDAFVKSTSTETEFLASTTLAITALLRAFMDMLPDPRFGPPNVGLTCASCDASSQDVHLAGHVDDCNFAHYLTGPPTDVPDEPMPKDQMVHLHAMKAELTHKLEVLVSEYKKDDNATATMLAFNRQAEAASKEGLKCGCPPVYQPRDPSVSPKRSGAEHAALRVVLPTLAGGPVVTAVQPAAVQPAAVQPAAVQPAAVQPAAVQPVQPTAAADLQWVQCEDCEKWRKLVLGAPAWEGEFKCEMNDWNRESASCDAKEDRDEEIGDAVLPTCRTSSGPECNKKTPVLQLQ